MRNIPDGLMPSNTWCPLGGTIWTGYRTLNRLTLAGGQAVFLWGQALRFITWVHFMFFLFAPCA